MAGRRGSSQGQFATLYLQESQQNNYLPAFVYYMLLQSNGPNGDGSEKGKDLAHLADPGVMKAYYADWTQLMRDIGKLWQARAGDRRAGPVGLHRAGGGGSSG